MTCCEKFYQAFNTVIGNKSVAPSHDSDKELEEGKFYIMDYDCSDCLNDYSIDFCPFCGMKLTV